MPKKRAHGEGSILKRKDGRWQGAVTVGYDDEGKQKRKTIYGKTQAEARKKMEEVKRQVADGVYSDSKHTVRTYLEHWLKEKARSVKPRTAELYREQAQRYVYPHIGQVHLTKLTPLHIQTLISKLADNIGANTANKVRTLLFNALKQAVLWQLIPRNPCEAVAKLKEETKEMIIWTPDETLAFIETAHSHRLFAAFYLAIFTGLRRGEILGLRWQDIDDDVIRVKQSLTILSGKPHLTTPKTSKGQRSLTVSENVVKILTEHQQLQKSEAVYLGESLPETDLVFTSQVGTPVHPRNFERAFKQLIKQAGVSSINLHGLRHLHVSLLVSKGLDLRAIADRVGHKNPSFTLDVYSHMFAEKRKDSAVGMSDLLDA